MPISTGRTNFTSTDQTGASLKGFFPWFVISSTAFLVFHTQPINTQARIAPIGRDTLETRWSARSKKPFPATLMSLHRQIGRASCREGVEIAREHESL